MSVPSLLHPPYFVYQACVAGEERCSEQDEKKAYQTPHFNLRHSQDDPSDLLIGPTPWEGPWCQFERC